MTKDEAKQAIEIMQAYIDGKKIEWALHGRHDWEFCNEPCFNFNIFEFRVKSEPKIIPFTFDDAVELIGKVVKYKESGSFCLITACTENTLEINDISYSYEILLEYFTFICGSPCGKLEV